MRAIEIACRHSCPGGNCSAEGGEPCDCSRCAGFRDAGGICHSERILDAAAMTRAADPVNAAAFDRMVENSGLV